MQYLIIFESRGDTEGEIFQYSQLPGWLLSIITRLYVFQIRDKSQKQSETKIAENWRDGDTTNILEH